MKCPTCPEATLVMSARDGVEIDYCPSCRGVWLDRGELDKIIERNSHEQVQVQQPTQSQASRPADNGQSHRPDFVDSDSPGYKQHSPTYGYSKHKKSWLNQIFD